jgi:hypothetical protein
MGNGPTVKIIKTRKWSVDEEQTQHPVLGHGSTLFEMPRKPELRYGP